MRRCYEAQTDFPNCSTHRNDFINETEIDGSKRDTDRMRSHSPFITYYFILAAFTYITHTMLSQYNTRCSATPVDANVQVSKKKHSLVSANEMLRQECPDSTKCTQNSKDDEEYSRHNPLPQRHILPVQLQIE